MEDKDAEDRIKVVRPVASKPRSSFKSCSELIDASDTPLPFDAGGKTFAIRPKSVRLGSISNPLPLQTLSSLDDVLDTEICCSSDNDETRSKSSATYKPATKYVSRSGNCDRHLPETPTKVHAPTQAPNKCLQHFKNQTSSRSHQDFRSDSYTPHMVEPVNPGFNLRVQQPATGGGGLSYDGYNWRKYGQKQVKGSPHPRSYYKCTQANCSAKKKFERSLDGGMVEIVYNGEHNHPKPNPPTHLPCKLSGKAMACDENRKKSGKLSLNSCLVEKNERLDDTEDVGLSEMHVNGVIAPTTCDGGSALPEVTCRHCQKSGGDGETGGGQDEPPCKRRRSDASQAGISLLAQDVVEPQVLHQNYSESDVSGDGYRWQKYGQKVVKGNPYPRSYYRCTNMKCDVRKRVERSFHDPNSVITTYEGKHNHGMPSRNASAVAFDQRSRPSSSKTLQ